MELKDRFQTLSPLDHRYYLANQVLFDRLAQYLSEEAQVLYCVRVECALLRQLAERLLSKNKRAALFEVLDDLPQRVTAREVYAEEEITKHNIRAVVNVLQRYVPESARHLVHLGATSVDILDTGTAMRYRDVSYRVLLPQLAELQEALLTVVEREAETVQMGRTHGQFAVPITVGFALAEYVSRLGEAIAHITHYAGKLHGKLSGAVGAYNATSMLDPDPRALEAAVLADLGLTPGEHATQIVSPEPLLRLLLEYNVAFGIVANIADDLRNLQRSEIGEVHEFFAAEQVGSSTMPHKRNPWNAEHVKSLWKAFAPRAMSWFMDQISEHQRDLTNSASGRFVAEYLAGFAAAVARLTAVVRRLGVDQERMRANVKTAGAMVMAEPLYILLAAAGVSDGHEQIRQLTLEAERSGETVVACAMRNRELWRTIERTCHDLTGRKAELFFADPANYAGRAAERAKEIAAHRRVDLNRWREQWREQSREDVGSHGRDRVRGGRAGAGLE